MNKIGYVLTFLAFLSNVTNIFCSDYRFRSSNYYPVSSSNKTTVKIVNPPHIPDFKYFKFNDEQNPIYENKIKHKLSLEFRNAIKTVPLAEKELDKYDQVLKDTKKHNRKWSRISLIPLAFTLYGGYMIYGNRDYEKNRVIGVKTNPRDAYINGPYIYEPYDDKSIRAKYDNGIIIASSGAVLGLAAVFMLKTFDREKYLLNILNTFNKNSKDKIELIIVSNSQNIFQVAFVKKF